MEPALFLVRAALDTLVRDLVRDGLAAGAVAITLHLDGGRQQRDDLTPAETITREVRPAHPLARVAPLFERCRALLSDWTLVAPICGVTVTLTNTVPATGEQGDLLDAGWRDPGAALAALERLRSTLGPDAVMRPVLRDDHRTEQAGAWAELVDGDDAALAAANVRWRRTPSARAVMTPHRSHTPAPGCHSLPVTARATPAALRLLETPQPVRMTCDADHRPIAGVWQSHTFTVQESHRPGTPHRCLVAHTVRTRLLVSPHPRSRHTAPLPRPDAWVLQGWYD